MTVASEVVVLVAAGVVIGYAGVVMIRTPHSSRARLLLLLMVMIAGTAIGVLAACTGRANGTTAATEGWTAANTVGPEALARELSTATGVDKPVVVFTGPPFLYRTGHVPGAVAYGPATDPRKIADMKAWAQGLPRSTNLVVYCGCCPLDVCPNLQPSFAALRSMGFTRLRALMLPTSFGQDWASKGLPIER